MDQKTRHENFSNVTQETSRELNPQKQLLAGALCGGLAGCVGGALVSAAVIAYAASDVLGVVLTAIAGDKAAKSHMTIQEAYSPNNPDAPILKAGTAFLAVAVGVPVLAIMGSCCIGCASLCAGFRKSKNDHENSHLPVANPYLQNTQKTKVALKKPELAQIMTV